MTKVLVLMKAMPFTKGHEDLIRFASNFMDSATDIFNFRDDSLDILIDTALDEPMINERIQAIHSFTNRSFLFNTEVSHINFEAQSEDESDTYWQDWAKALQPFEEYDYVIGSEDYCFKIAEMIGARYIPFDPNRELSSIKATPIRDDLMGRFDEISTYFQPYLRKTITIFGAESTGKTTLSKWLAESLNAHWTFEWARPYLETVGTEINVQSMTDIWYGQHAIEFSAYEKVDKPFIIRDTDLYSTIGYWEQPHWQETLGEVPQGLINAAEDNKADLHIILKSDIPFEQDPLRYGGDRRESDDDYWISVAEKYDLNYVVLDRSQGGSDRAQAQEMAINLFFDEKCLSLENFNRKGN